MIGIIGAGPGGLTMARALAEAGLSCELLERHSAVGGVWDIESPGSPMYESAHMIGSRGVSGFPEFPMPETLPDYPRHSHVLAYLRSYAAHYGIEPHVRFGSDVVSIEPLSPLESSGWAVVLRSGERRTYRALVLATGMQWHPRHAAVPGTFAGEIYHAREYRSLDQLAGRRVLVVGSGNSGADIACDAATAALSATLSMRRGNWIVPKYMFGVPADTLSRGGSRLPIRLRQAMTERMLRTLVGDLRRFGLPQPRHHIYEIPPMITSELIERIGHGDVRVAPAVAAFDGREVSFVDGSRVAFDLVIMATGYEVRFPYSTDAYLDARGGIPDLFLHMVHRTRDDLVVLGLPTAEAGGLVSLSAQANLAARVLGRLMEGEASLAGFRALKASNPDLSGGIRFLRDERNVFAVSARRYREHLAGLAEQLDRRSM